MYSIQQFKNDNQGTLVASRGGITGQCVSLVQKWAEVNGVGGSPVFPVANARDMNATTRTDAFTWTKNIQGDPNSKPQPGDIVVFSWNHTGLCEASDGYTITMFQQNDPTGSTAHTKNYSFNGCTGWLTLKNKGGVSMADIVTTDELRIIHSEMEGWPLHETHQGKFDGQFNASWGGQPLRTVLWDKWNKNDGWRVTRQNALAYYGTKAANDALVADLRKQLADTTKQYQDLLAKPPVASGGIDQATKDTIIDTNTKVSWIQALLDGIFKKRR